MSDTPETTCPKCGKPIDDGPFARAVTYGPGGHPFHPHCLPEVARAGVTYEDHR